MRHLKGIKKTSWKLKLSVVWIIVLGIAGFFVSPYGKKTIASVKEGYQELTKKAHLVVDQVEVEGSFFTDKKDIIKALNVVQGASIFDVDLVQSREKLLELPWVKTAVIERRLPSTLFIKITEKKALAIWQKKEKKKETRYYLLDTDGKIIRDDGKTKLPPLLLIVGDGADKHILELNKILENYPVVLNRLKSVVWSGDRRWDLYLDDVDGLIIKLPDTDVEAALSELMLRDKEEKILTKNLKVIDLRVKNQVVVRLKEGKK